jgi:hypothetical protein
MQMIVIKELVLCWREKQPDWIAMASEHRQLAEDAWLRYNYYL